MFQTKRKGLNQIIKIIKVIKVRNRKMLALVIMPNLGINKNKTLTSKNSPIKTQKVQTKTILKRNGVLTINKIVLM